MEDIRSLMLELDGADAETVERIAMERGSLPVRLAMLGLASVRRGEDPLWWGYPPGVFISYKREGEAMRGLVTSVADHVRSLGYRPFLDVEHLDDEADAYFQIPTFITSLQECTFYLLLLNRASLRLIYAGGGKTTWIHDEFQHALRLVKAGRLIMVPILLEPEGMPGFFDATQVIDLTAEPRDLAALNAILTPSPLALPADETTRLTNVVAEFDRLFLAADWDASIRVLRTAAALDTTFDHRFRQMLHALYTADEDRFVDTFDGLAAEFGQSIVLHLYRGYCAAHGIPTRIP